jgi:hypothetical protein
MSGAASVQWGRRRGLGDLWYFLAALSKELVIRSQNSLYKDLGRLATTIIQ